MPKRPELRGPWAASAAAIRSFDGMHPTRAQVVPSGPPSISAIRPAWLEASRNADIPAVPAPRMATSKA